MKIFNWTERRNSYSDLNTGRARRAVLSVPAHLKPARRRRAHNCSHQHSTAQHRHSLSPSCPHQGSHETERTGGILGRETRQRAQGTVGKRARRPAAGECGSDKCGIGLTVENIQTVQTVVESHVGQRKKQGLLMWRIGDFQRKQLN